MTALNGAPRFQQTLLECLTEAALDGVIVIAADGQIVALNRRFADLWRLPAAAVRERDRAAVTARILEQIADPQAFVARSDYLHRHPHEAVSGELTLRDGRIFEHYSTPIASAGGEFYGRLGWYRDVTERSRADAALRASRDQLDAILGGVADGVTVVDEAGRFVYANAAAARIAGFDSPEAFLAQSFAELARRLEVVDGEGRPFPFSELPSQRALRGASAPEMLVQFRRVDRDEVRWLLIRSRAMRGADGEGLAISIFHDQTERLLAERRLRFLAEAGALVPASLDEAELLSGVTRLAARTLADWAAVYVQGDGGALQRMAVTHRDPQRAVLAEDLERNYPPRPDEDSPLLDTLREGTPRLVPTVEAEALARYARDPEHLRLLQALGCTSALFVPLVARGRVLGVLGLFAATAGRRFGGEDLALTEEVGRRTALALDNARLYTRARDAVRASDEFLSIAAHELRTPVTIVTGLAQLLQRDRRRGSLDDVRLDRALKLIAESSARLAALTDDLLDVSRLQTGHFSVRAEPVDLVSFVRALVERDAERLDERRRLTFGGDAAACVVNADPVRLEQVLVNLIDNAVKYSPDGGPVDVAVRRAGAAGAAAAGAAAAGGPADGAIVEVRDQGIGVPPGAEATIFQPFGRAPNAAARQIRGMGLGLYLCRNIVERHGGRIWAESPGEGQGTTVRFWLPTVADHLPAAAASGGAGG